MKNRDDEGRCWLASIKSSSARWLQQQQGAAATAAVSAVSAATTTAAARGSDETRKQGREARVGPGRAAALLMPLKGRT